MQPAPRTDLPAHHRNQADAAVCAWVPATYVPEQGFTRKGQGWGAPGVQSLPNKARAGQAASVWHGWLARAVLNASASNW